MATLKSYIEAPRWAGVPSFLKQLAWKLNLKLDITEDKCLLTTIVYFKLQGDDSNIHKAKQIIEQSIKEYYEN